MNYDNTVSHKIVQKTKISTTKGLFFLAASLLLSAPVFAEGPDISGNYVCTGQDAIQLHSNYTDHLTVTKTNETFQFEWNMDKNLGVYKGTGYYFEGSSDTIALAFYQSSKTPKPTNPNAGIQVYKVNGDGSLSGTWTYVGLNKLNPVDTCVKDTTKK